MQNKMLKLRLQQMVFQEYNQSLIFHLLDVNFHLLF